jgi:hypothetical protein
LQKHIFDYIPTAAVETLTCSYTAAPLPVPVPAATQKSKRISTWRNFASKPATTVRTKANEGTGQEDESSQVVS